MTTHPPIHPSIHPSTPTHTHIQTFTAAGNAFAPTLAVQSGANVAAGLSGAYGAGPVAVAGQPQATTVTAAQLSAAVALNPYGASAPANATPVGNTAAAAAAAMPASSIAGGGYGLGLLEQQVNNAIAASPAAAAAAATASAAAAARARGVSERRALALMRTPAR